MGLSVTSREYDLGMKDEEIALLDAVESTDDDRVRKDLQKERRLMTELSFQQKWRKQCSEGFLEMHEMRVGRQQVDDVMLEGGDGPASSASQIKSVERAVLPVPAHVRSGEHGQLVASEKAVSKCKSYALQTYESYRRHNNE